MSKNIILKAKKDGVRYSPDGFLVKEAKKGDSIEVSIITAKALVKRGVAEYLDADENIKAKAEKLADEKAKAEKLADEKAKAEKLADEKAKAEKLADEKAKKAAKA